MAAKTKVTARVPEVFSIDDGIVRPPRTRRVTGTRKLKYPFATMEVGQSVFLPGRTPATALNATRVYSQRTGFKFSVRAWEEDGVQGARVWRIDPDATAADDAEDDYEDDDNE